MSRLVKNFDEAGSIEDAPRNGRSITVRAEENRHLVSQTLRSNPRTSQRSASHDLNGTPTVCPLTLRPPIIRPLQFVPTKFRPLTICLLTIRPIYDSFPTVRPYVFCPNFFIS